MNENDIEIEQGFYHAVADALECGAHSYRKFPYSKRTRWNGREPGNGRYPGHGFVRRYSSDQIHVHLHTPSIKGVFNCAKDVLTAIHERKIKLMSDEKEISVDKMLQDCIDMIDGSIDMMPHYTEELFDLRDRLILYHDGMVEDFIELKKQHGIFVDKKDFTKNAKEFFQCKDEIVDFSVKCINEYKKKNEKKNVD